MILDIVHDLEIELAASGYFAIRGFLDILVFAHDPGDHMILYTLICEKREELPQKWEVGTKVLKNRKNQSMIKAERSFIIQVWGTCPWHELKYDKWSVDVKR